MIGWIILGVIMVAALFALMLYNSLIRLRMRVKEAFSGIDVQLKRRADLIPNIVESVKGYAGHEKSVFENVASARSALMKATGPQEKAAADNLLTGALKTLFAVAENYPQLRASENFQQLQRELSDTENKIAYSRQYYNANVTEYNTKIALFPNILIAGPLGFRSEEFFGAAEGDRAKPQVKF